MSRAASDLICLARVNRCLRSGLDFRGLMPVRKVANAGREQAFYLASYSQLWGNGRVKLLFLLRFTIGGG